MLKILAKIFGFTTAVQAPPARQPSARKRPQAAPKTPPKPDRHVSQRPVVALRTPTIGEAVLAFAQDVGEVGSKPSPEFLALCRKVLGEDLWAYLQAVKLTDGRITSFAIGVNRIGDPAAEQGLLLRLEAKCYGDLDLWDEITRREAKRRDNAIYGGRPIPVMIAIPEKVLLALAKRIADRSAMARRARGGAAGQGGVVVTPPVPPEGQVGDGTPQGDPENPQGPDDSPAAGALPVPKRAV